MKRKLIGVFLIIFVFVTTLCNVAVYAEESGLDNYATAEASTIDLPAPKNFIPEAGNAKIDLYWDAVSGATGYTIERMIKYSGYFVTIAEQVSDTTFTDTDVSNGITYFYKVTAMVNGVKSMNSSQTVATPWDRSIFFPSPENLTATAGDSSVDLSWSAVQGANRYVVLRSTAVAGPYIRLSNMVSGTTFTDTTAKNGSTYFYVVMAGDDYVEGAYSNSASVTLEAKVDLPAPKNFIPEAGNAKIDLYWDAVPGATGYTIERMIKYSGYFVTIAEQVSDTTFTDTDVSNGITYFYKVTAMVNGVKSMNSSQTVATPWDRSIFFPSPENLTATAGDSSVDLSWSAVQGANRYVVLRSTAVAGPYIRLSNMVSGTTFTDTTAKNGSTYFYVVMAGDDYVEGAYSNSASVTLGLQ